MEFLPQEILIEILEYLNFQELLNLKKINKYFNNLIKQNKWKYITIIPNSKMSKKKLVQFIETHNFINYDFNDFDITDNELKYLSNCETLNLSWCNITDEGIQYLRNCNKLNLYQTNITDMGLKYLSNCETLNLGYCKITDEGIILFHT